MAQIARQISLINDIFLSQYLKALEAKKNPELSQKLRLIFDFQKRKHNAKEWKKFLAKEFGIEKIDSFEDLKSAELNEIMFHFAKINDVFKKFRVIANQQYFKESEISKKVADSFSYVLGEFEKKELSALQVQDVLDKMRFSPSLTAHPTNPTSVAHTVLAMDLVRAFSCGNKEEFYQKLNDFLDVDIIGPKKTQKQEVEEGLAYLNSIYNGIDEQYESMEKAIQNSSYAGNVVLRDDMNQICAWLSGDGDGNVNATRESLSDNIEMFRAAIKEKYIAELKVVLGDDLETFGFHGDLYEQFKDSKEFIAYLEGNIMNRRRLDVEGRKKIANLVRKVKTFGYHYAKIDVRHEAGDIMKVAIALLKAIGENVDVEEITNDEILRYLNDEEIIAKIAKFRDSKMLQNSNFGDSEHDELVKRLFGRFCVVAQNSEMFEKIIIAEFKESKQISAVLLMLKAAGNKVCEHGSTLNVVALAESKQDLERLGNDIATALKQPAYLEHIKNTKKIFFMIAKSDTVRRNGVGAQYSQEKAVRNSIKSIIRTLLESGIADLENYQIIPYNGGGHALQRGGGRVTEMPSVYARYALKAINELKKEFKDEIRSPHWMKALERIQICAPCLTTQGHQNGILYVPSEVAAATLEAFNSQAAYGEARRIGLIEDHEVDKSTLKDFVKYTDQDRQKAYVEELRQDVEVLINAVCEIAVREFEFHIGNEKSKSGETPIDRLFANGPWLSTMTGNNSSRSNKRGISDNDEEIQTVKKARGGGGDKNSLLKQRAIGVEKICAHSGTNLISWFGWSSGLQRAKKHGHEINLLYDFSKTFRDYMRSCAISLYMTDFDASWKILCGKERISDAEINAFDESYRSKMESGLQSEISDDETMSFIECEAMRTAKLVYEVMNDKEASIDFKMEDIMSKFPEICDEIDAKHNNSGFANFIQANLSDLSNKNGDALFDKELRAFVRRSYCANDVAVNAPLGSCFL